MFSNPEFIALVLMQFLSIGIFVGTTRTKFKAHDDQLKSHGEHHEKHFAHAEKADIHQTAMSTKLTESLIENVRLTVANIDVRHTTHVDDDRRRFDKIESKLESIELGFAKESHLTRESMHQVRDLMGKLVTPQK